MASLKPVPHRGGRHEIDGSPAASCDVLTGGTTTYGAYTANGFMALAEAVVTFTTQAGETRAAVPVPVGVMIPVYVTSITVTSGTILVFKPDGSATA